MRFGVCIIGTEEALGKGAFQVDRLPKQAPKSRNNRCEHHPKMWSTTERLNHAIAQAVCGMPGKGMNSHKA